MKVADPMPLARRTLTEEALALLRQKRDSKDEGPGRQFDELGPPGLPSFRERLALGDISW